jgi:hypothetical protein
MKVKRKPVEPVRDFKDRIAAKIRGVSVETFILTKKLKQQEAYRKLVTHNWDKRGY